MSFWSVESIKSALGATFVVRATSPAPLDRVSIDSRTTGAGSVFIAIKGEKTDGHGYLAQALAGGAGLLVIHDVAAISGLSIPPAVSVLQVPETGAALLRLAAAYRRTLETTRVIAIGGSNGKTTTCKLLQGVLSSQFRGTASPKSFNNAIGVPLTILSARRGDQYLICEVGTNSPGEIAPLAAVIEPDIAVITSIGREHLEGLGSLAGVIAEEATLLTSLRPGGTAVVTAECPELLDGVRPMVQRRMAAGTKACTLLTFGRAAGADLRVADIEVTAESTTFTINQRERYSVSMPGAHNACNAAAVIAVARRMGMTQPDIERALASASGPEMRMQRSSIAGVHFINDAYNANPDSALAAIDTYARAFAKTPGTLRRVLVLGDMLELGDGGPDLHRELGDAVAAAGCFDLVICVGQLSMYAAERLMKARRAPSLMSYPDAAANNAAEIASLFKPGDSVLLKASRGTGLERIVTAFTAAQGPIIEARPDAAAVSPPSI